MKERRKLKNTKVRREETKITQKYEKKAGGERI
jgi:hypothetical protein